MKTSVGGPAFCHWVTSTITFCPCFWRRGTAREGRMALKSLPSYRSLPSPEITLAQIINTCVGMCGVKSFSCWSFKQNDSISRSLNHNEITMQFNRKNKININMAIQWCSFTATKSKTKNIEEPNLSILHLSLPFTSLWPSRVPYLPF